MKARPALFTAALLALGALALPPAQAEGIRPGLWEFTVTVGSGKGPTQKELVKALRKLQAALPEEARREQEQQAARTHLRMSDTATTSNACVTPAQAAQRERLFQPAGKCTSRRSKKVGGTMKFSYSCTDPHASGAGSVTFYGSTGFTEVVRGTSRNVWGDRTFDMTFSTRTRARWLGAACGDVAPEPDERQDGGRRRRNS